jgi:NADPH-dependent 2,4-dienoyl-CoA reductase/sulfur reductase-like enzyme/rhodanese-related sulfurtransferase
VSGAARRRVVVVGASAAGLRCAARLARLEPATTVTVVEARESYSFAACGLPYVLSGDLDDVAALRTTADGALRDDAYFRDVKGVSVRAGWRGVRVDVAARRLEVRSSSGQEECIAWDDLVIATGARPRRLPFQPQHPRVAAFHTADDLPQLLRGLTGGSLNHVAVVGAGLVGCELAEAFRTLWGIDVTVVEAAPAPLPGVCDPEIGYLVERAMTNKGVRLVAGEAVVAIEADDRRIVVRTTAHAVEADLAVVAVGVEPAVELARDAGIRLGPTGAIAVDERLATSEPRVWAAGDCVEVIHAVTGEPCHLPLGSLANRQGRTLANVLAGRDDAFPPVAGAVAVKVFDLNVAAVGVTRGRAEQRGLRARSAWTTAHDRAHYWPEAREVAIHLVYEQGTRRILGVQAAGPGEVAKRVDVATQVVARGGSLRDLVHVEHAYAPPFAPALEPLAVAACVAENQEEGVAADPPVGQLAGRAILDVRHGDEQERRPVGTEAVTAAPLETLRDAPPAGQREWLVVCERGTRSAEAVRYLRSRAVQSRYLGGGLRWREIADDGGPR